MNKRENVGLCVIAGKTLDKQWNTYQIFCLENESKVSYIMPIRVLEYEAGRYMGVSTFFYKYIEKVKPVPSLHTSP